jgi:hypothetical protein
MQNYKSKEIHLVAQELAPLRLGEVPHQPVLVPVFQLVKYLLLLMTTVNMLGLKHLAMVHLGQMTTQAS